MSNYSNVTELLKNYKINRARVSFIENQIKRYGLEGDMDIGMNSDADSEKNIPYMNFMGSFGLCSIKEENGEYDEVLIDTQNKIIISLRNELNNRKMLIGLVDDALDMLGNMDDRYKTIIEEFYIKSNRMEDIAENVHISRSKCYELCKEAVTLLEQVILGDSNRIKHEVSDVIKV